MKLTLLFPVCPEHNL